MGKDFIAATSWANIAVNGKKQCANLLIKGPVNGSLSKFTKFGRIPIV